MDGKLTRSKTTFEVFLIFVALGTAVLFGEMGPFKIVVLNLFYLPIILSGYFLGRTHAGVLALLCVLTVTITSTLVPTGFAAFETPPMIGLVIAVWGGVLGLSAILVGTLCDERAKTVKELHQAYVGVVEVLSKYLQGGNPRVKARSVRIAELSQLVAEELKLPQKIIDDIRVAAMLHELGSIEITTQIINKAFDALGEATRKHTFQGTELVHSLASVLDGALPLLAVQDEAVCEYLAREPRSQTEEMPIGGRIIQAVRAYDDATSDIAGQATLAPAEALRKIHTQSGRAYDGGVLQALTRVVQKTDQSADLELAYT